VFDLVADLKTAFPRDEMTPRRAQLYADHLADLSPEVLEVAVQGLINSSAYLPPISAIREAAVELTLRLPTEDEALAQIEARIRWRQQDELSRGEAPAVHVDVREALEHVGGFFAFRAAENPSVVRGQFLGIYRRMRSGRVLEAQRGSGGMKALAAV
jgi:hypothetical protein